MEFFAKDLKEIFSNQYVILALTFAVFYAVRLMQIKTRQTMLNPVLIAIVLLIGYLKVTDVSFETFRENSALIEFWLKPAVVALGVPLYLQFAAIKRLWFPIVLAQFIGSIVGIVSVVLTAKLFGASDVVILSLASKSVTTPVAIEVTESVGGIPALTAAAVIITGILGAIMGFKTLSMGHVHSPIAQGLAMGSSSHALGASAAMSRSSKYGAFASLGIILNCVFTALLTPTILRLMGII